MPGNKFPISDYYRNNILDAVTISRRGGWWSALLVISDPRTDKPFIGLYRWQKDGDVWKTRNRYFLKKFKDAQSVIENLGEFSDKFLRER